MPSKNIFGGQSARALFAHYVYEELRKREFVTLVDVLCIYYKCDKSYMTCIRIAATRRTSS